MDFFNKTKESLKNAGSNLSQKANNVSGTVTITMKIKDNEKNLKDSYADIAKIMVDECPEEVQKYCPELLKSVQELRKQLEYDRRQLAVCKGMQICPNCGSEESNDIICCTKCGANIQEVSKYMMELEAQDNTCRVCGSILVNDCAFCPNCGSKRE